MEILLDTNFAVTCMKQKIDFFSLAHDISTEPIQWAITENVVKELKKISENKEKTKKNRDSAKLFLELLEENKLNIRVVKTKIENVDEDLIAYCSKNPLVVLATLDKEIKRRIKNKILTIRGKRFLEFI